MQPYRLFQAEEEVMLWTAWPLAPFSRLSIIETISSLSSCFNR